MNASEQSKIVPKPRRCVPRALIILSLAMMGLGWAALPPRYVQAQATFQRITGRTFDGAVPRDFVLETFAIPVEKRNAALVKTPQGSRLLLALLDTSGYSSQVQQKYIGMIIAEGRVEICGHPFGTGSYGFGLTKPIRPGPGPAEFRFYDQVGIQLASCPAARDEKLPQPRPLQVQWSGQTEARLYVGRYWAAFR